MSTNLTDNFLYKGKKPLDDRQLFKTKADMKAFPESALPTLYDAFCEEDGNKYVFNKANEINEETGKWRIFKGGSDSSVDLSKYQKIKDDTLTTTDKTITGAINELKEEVGDNPVHYLGEGDYVGGSIDEVKKINNIGDLYLCNNAIDQIISGAMQDDKITFDYLPNATSNIIYISYEESIQILFNKEESVAGTYTVGYFIKYPKYGDTAFKSEEVNITPGEWVTFKNPDYTKCEYLVIKHDFPAGGGVVIESIKTRHYNQYSPHLYIFTEYGWMSTSNFERSNYYSKTEVKELIGDNPVHYLDTSVYDFPPENAKIGDLYLLDSSAYVQTILGSSGFDPTKGYSFYESGEQSYLIRWPYGCNEIKILYRCYKWDRTEQIGETYDTYWYKERPKEGDTPFVEQNRIKSGEWISLTNPDTSIYKYITLCKTLQAPDYYYTLEVAKIDGIGETILYVYTKDGWVATSGFERNNYYSKTEVEELIDDATSISNSKFLTEDIEVKGIIDGLGYKNGDIISKDITANDFIKTLMRRVIPPTYIKPTYKVTITPSIVEVGKETTFNCVGTFTQNDAGTATTLIVKDYKDTEAYNGEYKNSISLTETIPTAGKYNHTFTINYNEGAVKQNNFGEDDETGKITAGSINITKQIEAVYPYYIGVSDTDILDEAKVTALTKKIETKNNKTIDFTTSQSHMVFAYPKEYGSIKSIIDANGFNVTDSFTITTLSINSIDYYIYVSNKCSDKYTMNFNY